MEIHKGLVTVAMCASVLVACKTATLSGEGAHVATAQSAPVDYGWDPSSCKELGYVVGRGGGSFGGGWITNEQLISYAMNDLRNKAAELGANYVQHDTPTLGQSGSNGGTTTSTATVSGTAYSCSQRRSPQTVAQASPACVKGITQACVGAGGCQGGQACLPDGSGFSPCDCGHAAARP